MQWWGLGIFHWHGHVTVQQSTGLRNIFRTWQCGDVKCSAEWDKKSSEGVLCTRVHCTSNWVFLDMNFSTACG